MIRAFTAIFAELLQSKFSFLLFASVKIIISVFANTASHGYNNSFSHFFVLSFTPKLGS